jgi:hypothetical protein
MWSKLRENRMDKQQFLKWGRLLIGFAFLSLIFWGPHTYWGLLGIIPIGVALSDHCPFLAGLKYFFKKKQ